MHPPLLLPSQEIITPNTRLVGEVRAGGVAQAVSGRTPDRANATRLRLASSAIRDWAATHPLLLYERILGRPYASHRDSISEGVGDLVEMRIEELLDGHRINYRKTRRREAIPGFPQAPDFLIADRGKAIGAAEPEVDVAIEAKLTEDDGTARDKVARIKALRLNEDRRRAQGAQRRQIVAVIDGRGFQHRVRDLADALEACDGHVYTLAELDKLVEAGGPLHPYLGTSA